MMVISSSLPRAVAFTLCYDIREPGPVAARLHGRCFPALQLRRVAHGDLPLALFRERLLPGRARLDAVATGGDSDHRHFTVWSVVLRFLLALWLSERGGLKR